MRDPSHVYGSELGSEVDVNDEDETAASEAEALGDA